MHLRLVGVHMCVSRPLWQPPAVSLTLPCHGFRLQVLAKRGGGNALQVNVYNKKCWFALCDIGKILPLKQPLTESSESDTGESEAGESEAEESEAGESKAGESEVSDEEEVGSSSDEEGSSSDEEGSSSEDEGSSSEDEGGGADAGSSGSDGSSPLRLSSDLES
jgi:hypothetical protein